MWRRVYIEVLAEHKEDGTVLPRYLTWMDNRKYEIDRVTQMVPCAARKAGGHGIRYTVSIRGQERYPFREGDRWFIEYDGPDCGGESEGA